MGIDAGEGDAWLGWSRGSMKVRESERERESSFITNINIPDQPPLEPAKLATPARYKSSYPSKRASHPHPDS